MSTSNIQVCMTWKNYLKPDELAELETLELKRKESAVAFEKLRRLLQSRCQSRMKPRKGKKLAAS